VIATLINDVDDATCVRERDTRPWTP